METDTFWHQDFFLPKYDSKHCQDMIPTFFTRSKSAKHAITPNRQIKKRLLSSAKHAITPERFGNKSQESERAVRSYPFLPMHRLSRAQRVELRKRKPRNAQERTPVQTSWAPPSSPPPRVRLHWRGRRSAHGPVLGRGRPRPVLLLLNRTVPSRIC